MASRQLKDSSPKSIEKNMEMEDKYEVQALMDGRLFCGDCAQLKGEDPEGHVQSRFMMGREPSERKIRSQE